MAKDKSKGSKKGKGGPKQFAVVHRLAAAVSLVGFMVTILAGVMSEARVMTIVYRSVGVIFLIGVVSRIVIRVLASYEEMNSGKA